MWTSALLEGACAAGAARAACVRERERDFGCVAPIGSALTVRTPPVRNYNRLRELREAVSVSTVYNITLTNNEN